MPIRPEAYVATMYLTFAIVIIAMLVIVSALILAIWIDPRVPPIALVPAVALLVLVPGITYIIMLTTPGSKAKARGKKIDAQASHALNYMSSLASSGVAPATIIVSLSRQKVFGELAIEAGYIARDLEALGKDLGAALQEAKESTPSERFQNLLQGTAAALSSGVDVKEYFSGKAEQFAVEDRQRTRQSLEGLSVLAESFVTVVVAGPTFLIVLLSVMANLGSGAKGGLTFGYMLILLVLPVAQAGFTFAILSDSPEG